MEKYTAKCKDKNKNSISAETILILLESSSLAVTRMYSENITHVLNNAFV